MRTFLILAFFTSTMAFAQVDPGTGADGACTEATVTTGAVEYNCTTLTIGAGNHIFPSVAGQIVRIKVQGNVTIASGAVLVLSGGDGSPAPGVTAGGVAGPGGSDGGDDGAGGPNDAPDPPNGGLQGTSDPGGPCGAGGGGGGFATAGTDGTDCSGPIPGGTGGDAYTNLATVFRGGFGGAAAGSTAAGLPITSATGGGGGGAIWISAGGDITINGNIDVRGGKGGNGEAASNAGGGGGGSGGAIRIQASGEVVNNGTFLLAGGAGGSGDGGGKSGGAGAAGLYEFEDVDNVIHGTGTGAIGAEGGAGESFKSSITCGLVKNKQDHQMYQVMVGFMIVVLISRIRGRSRRSA